jgi:cyclohexanone monooxygenase
MDYVRHLIQRYKLLDVIQFKSYVSGATWDDAAKTWTVEVQKALEDGSKETQHWTGKHLVLATGCLSAPNIPKFAGQDEFKGELYHTARVSWRRERGAVSHFLRLICDLDPFSVAQERRRLCR